MHARLYGRPLTRVLTVLVCALALPSAAAAASGSGGSGLSGPGSPTGAGSSSGGSGSGGSGTSGSGTGSPAPVSALPAPGPVTVSDNGITVQMRASALLRRRLSFSGTASGDAGQTIEIERAGRPTHGRWVPTVSATVGSDGSFSATWHTTQVGRFAIRAIKLSNAPVAHAAAAQLSNGPTVSIYRGARATIYGPGFYGRRTACGARLTRTTIGVANRRLPCGTEVSLMYHGRELTVPVIDRGPYANGASWDVTFAAARALGMSGTEWIGSIALPKQTNVLPAFVGRSR